MQGRVHGVTERHDFKKATEALMSDHRTIEKVLSLVEKLVAGSVEVSLETWGKTVDFIKNFADKCHHLKEEKVLFPFLETKGVPREGGPIGMMLLEHEEGRGYVRAMAEALAHGGENPDMTKGVLIENAGAYLRMLKQHIMKEDEVLFPMADDALSDEEQRKLLREFEEHEEREIGAGVHEKYVKLAQELEALAR